MAAAKRLTPKPEVLKNLFALSGNCCAIADCNAVLIDGKGTVVGRICHIEAAEKGGPRFNPVMSDEQRRAASNLILLCSPHHTIIDDKKRESEWSVSSLRKIKAASEDRFREIGATLQVAFEHQFRDKTASRTVLEAANLGLAPRHELFEELTEQELKSCIVELRSYARSFRSYLRGTGNSCWLSSVARLPSEKGILFR